MRLPLPVRISSSAVLASILVGGAPLRQVSQVRLADTLAEPTGWSAARGHPVLAVAFSPDGSKLAVTMDDHYAGGFRTHLLILNAQNLQKPFRQFNLETCGNFLQWAPDGNAILVCGTVVRLDEGTSCDLLRTPLERAFGNHSNRSYWLGAGRLIRVDRTITDLSCRPLGTWDIEGNWAVAGTEPARGWMLLRQSAQRTFDGKTLPFNSYVLADRDTHKFTSGIFLADTFGEGTTVAPGAAAVCSTVEHPRQDKQTLGCWSLPSADVIPIASELASYWIAQASTNTPVVAAEHWGYHAWDLLGETPDYLNVILVDIRSGHRFTSLKPPMQHGNGATSSDIRNWYFQYALSPDGRFLAEGGDGDLRLFQLQ